MNVWAGGGRHHSEMERNRLVPSDQRHLERTLAVWEPTRPVWAVSGIDTIVKWNGVAWSTQSSGRLKLALGSVGNQRRQCVGRGRGRHHREVERNGWSLQSSGTSNWLVDVGN